MPDKRAGKLNRDVKALPYMTVQRTSLSPLKSGTWTAQYDSKLQPPTQVVDMRTWHGPLAQSWKNIAKYPALSAAMHVHTGLFCNSRAPSAHGKTFWSAGPCSPPWASVGCGVGPTVPPAPDSGVVGHRGSPRGHSLLSLLRFERKAPPPLGNNDSRSLPKLTWLRKAACITLSSIGTGNWKTCAHLPRYPCYRHRRFPWQRCIQAPSSRSGRHTASCSDPACISRCHCTNQGSHLVEEMEKVSTRRTRSHSRSDFWQYYCADKKARFCRWDKRFPGPEPPPWAGEAA